MSTTLRAGRASMRSCGRRQALASGLGLMAAAAGAASGMACAPPARPSSVAPAELYVGLARDRVVAILDTVTDRVIQRISLAALGRQGHLSQIGVAPSGTAAILPVTGAAKDVGLVAPREQVSQIQSTAPTAPLPGRLRFQRGTPAPQPAASAVCT